MLNHESVLARMKADWSSRGWTPDSLASYVMQEGENGGETPPADTPKADTPKAEAPTADDIAKLTRALEAERSLRRDAESKAKEADTFRTKVEELESASKSDLEKAVEAARKEGRKEANEAANQRLRSSEARALAAQAKFRDASDAVRFLDLSTVKVTDDGTVDAGAISEQLAELAKDKPYLLVDDTPPPPPDPKDAGIGVGSKSKGADVAPGMGRLRQAYATQ